MLGDRIVELEHVFLVSATAASAGSGAARRGRAGAEARPSSAMTRLMEARISSIDGSVCISPMAEGVIAYCRGCVTEFTTGVSGVAALLRHVARRDRRGCAAHRPNPTSCACSDYS